MDFSDRARYREAIIRAEVTCATPIDSPCCAWQLLMIASFHKRGTEDVFNSIDSKAARRTCPVEIWSVARRKLDQINQAADLHDLRVPLGNHLEVLKGERAGQHSIRINDQYRICLQWTRQGAADVEITDYH
jgi:proteic killer suppression protein